MLEAIYAWRRNGGMGARPSLRDRTPSWISARVRGIRIRFAILVPTTNLSANPLHLVPFRSTPPPSPGSRFFSHLVNQCAPAQIDHRFLPKKRERYIIWSDALYNHPVYQESLLPESSASRTGARRGSAYHRVCGTVTGGVPCPRLTPKLRVVFLVAWIQGNVKARRYALDPFRINVRRSAVGNQPLKRCMHPSTTNIHV